MPLHHLAEELPAQYGWKDIPFVTDAGLFQYTIAKWITLRSRPDRLTAVFWSGGRECTWLPASPRGSAPLDQLRTFTCPEDAERGFLAVYPEYRS